MLAWKIAPGAGDRQHRRPQAGRDDAADRAAVRRDLPAGRPAAGRRQHRHRRRRHRRGAGRAPGRRQGRLHRLDRGRPGDRQSRCRQPQEGSPSSSAARPRTSSSTTPRSTRPSRASSTASSSTRATSAAPARGCWCRSRWPTRWSPGCKRRMATLRVGDPLDKNTDVGAINSAEQLDRITELVAAGEAEGAERWSAAVRAARTRVLVLAHGVHRRRPGAPHRPGGDLRAGAVGADLPHPGRGGREGEQHPVRAVGRHLDREGLAASCGWPTGCAPGVVWANTFNRFDPTSPFGGYKESGYGREGGRHGLAAYAEGGASSESRALGRPQDVQALRRRRSSRAASRRASYEVLDAAGRFARQRRAWLAQGRPGRRGRGARGVRGWSGATAYNRGQVLYRVAEVMEGRHAPVRQRSPAPRG